MFAFLNKGGAAVAALPTPRGATPLFFDASGSSLTAIRQSRRPTAGISASEKDRPAVPLPLTVFRRIQDFHPFETEHGLFTLRVMIPLFQHGTNGIDEKPDRKV